MTNSDSHSGIRHPLGLILTLAVVLALIPQLLKLPLIFSAFVAIVLGWYGMHSFKGIRLPGSVLKFLFFFTAIALVFTSLGLRFTQHFSITLLTIMLSMKMFEIKDQLDRRNIFIVIFLGLFLSGSHFLNSQSILMILYNSMVMIIFIGLLAAYNRLPQHPFSVREILSTAGPVMLQAIPLAVVLFVFFPRISEPLWGLPVDTQISRTGLTDSMFPGQITVLVDNNEVAFRVVFHGNVPDNQNLYWRGPVISKTDGFLWTRHAQQNRKKRADQIEYIAGETDYTITLEPHKRQWLFALDMPSSTIPDSYLSADNQLLSRQNIRQVKRYQLTSYTKYRIPYLDEQERLINLQLPANVNPRSVALGKQWRNQFSKDNQLVEHAYNYFASQPYSYTRLPPDMLENPIDQFLFEHKEGFCEHYATAFVYLMRAAEIPARVVTGYQGIEQNEIGDYYIVRQSNAHAWAEVWLDNKGWVRIDPTAAIPPERIKADIFDRQARQLAFSNLKLPDNKISNPGMLRKSLNFLQDNIDNIHYFWNKWIVGFDVEKQKSMLDLVGLKASLANLVSILVVFVLIVLSLLSLYWLYQSQSSIPDSKRYYLKFLSRLERAGLQTSLSMGPLELQKRALSRFPNHTRHITAIINNYIQCQYGKNPDKLILQKLQRSINELKL